jgi:hypothetical protein
MTQQSRRVSLTYRPGPGVAVVCVDAEEQKDGVVARELNRGRVRCTCILKIQKFKFKPGPEP